MIDSKFIIPALGASFAFTVFLFGIAMGSIGQNTTEIQIIHTDIKEILTNVHHIRGVIDGQN